MSVTVHEPQAHEPQVPADSPPPVLDPDPDYEGWSDEDVAALAAKAGAEHRRRQTVAGAQAAAARALQAHQAARGISDGTAWTEPAGYLDAVPPGGRRVYEGDLWENTSGVPVVHSPAAAPDAWTLIEEGVEPVEPDPGDYPEWAPGLALEVGDVVSYGGVLWEVVTAHTTQPGWEPHAGYMWRAL